jgi:hypothetical protein
MPAQSHPPLPEYELSAAAHIQNYTEVKTHSVGSSFTAHLIMHGGIDSPFGNDNACLEMISIDEV